MSPKGFDQNPDIPLHGDNLAYVIYTSGSTGRPKGAANRHRSLHSRLAWMQQAYALGEGDTVLQKTPFSFDVSVWEFFWPLMVGAKLAVAAPGDHREPETLVGLIERHQVSTLHFVPSMLQAFLAHLASQPGSAVACASLRRIVCSGEALPAQARDGVFQHLPQAGLHNLYGPTEAAIDVTHWTCLDDGARQVPIGRPISATQAWVLDAQLNPAPAGVAGELYLGGINLARGYLRRPGLTSERFIADPFEPAARLYRTGDLARWNHEGQLEYLGRTDHQVKIRGLRIELGEVEAQLLAQLEVREAVVVAQQGAGGARLVGYVSLNAPLDAQALKAELKDRLGRALPDYMVPALLVVLDTLPLNANGKVDRKALPSAEFGGGPAYEAPQGEVEESIAAAWAEVLAVPRVGRGDNFFELGGHSLLAVGLLEKLRGQGWNVAVRTLFQQPQLAAFAQALVQARQAEPAPVVVPPNRIPEGCEAIRPEMLTLVSLDPVQIDLIQASVPGGAKNIQDIYPLAPLQEGLLFHHLLQEQGDAYITSRSLRFDSRARLERFIDSFNQVIRRHDILRTAVRWEGLPEPVQVVHREAPIQLRWLRDEEPRPDRSLPVEERLRRHMDPKHYRIDLRQAPLVHAVAAPDEEGGDWLLQLPSHHLVLDHTTLDLLVREIGLIQQGRLGQLPEPVPFRRFVAQARLGVSQEEHQTFFTRMLGDVEEPTAPFGLTDVQGDGGGIREARLALSEGLSRAVRQQARQRGVSAASLFHLAWALVLGKTTGQDDVVFGTVLFGRMQGGREAERALGLFINTLPLRVSLDAGVMQGLAQTHRRLAELLHHEHASLSLAQRCSGLPAGTPLFSAILNYRYIAPPQEAGGGGDPWEGIQVVPSQERTNYPVGLCVDDLGEGFALTAKVDASIDAERLCAHMHTAVAALVEAVAGEAAQKVCDLGILDPLEQRAAARLALGPVQPDWPGVPVHQLIEEQARAHPEATALVCGAQALGYGELHRKANRLAHRLAAFGVRPETRVGIAAERSIDLVVGLLGVLRAGGAFVPLDPALPAERLAHQVEDSGAALVLCGGGGLAWSPGVPVLPLSPPDSAVDKAAAGFTPVPTHGSQAAYVIYTSGSTGRPKGVVVGHAALANYVRAVLSRLKLDDDTRGMAMVSTVAADLGHTVLFGALCSGRALHLVPADQAFEPEAFAAHMRGHRVDALKITPSHLQALLTAGNPADVLPRKKLVLGGEATPWGLLDRIASLRPGLEVMNHYGPTEATVGMLTQDALEADRGASTLPVGRPLANCAAYLLDARMQPVPIGVAGELYLAGAGLARGYEGRPGHTAERFVASPFPGHDRLYRTGDLMRWGASGQLEYLGRADHQVKIRGFRVEPGEVEARLRAQPGVRDALVLAQEGPSGGARLLAYVVPDETAPDAVPGWAEGLKKRLAASLPDHMVPAAVLPLPQGLPLNANGKVDRKALPAVDAAFDGRDHEAPQGELETRLAAIWEEVLGVARVGRRDNFFELGGHSLLSVQVVSRVQGSLFKNLAVRDVFQHPVLMDLAAAIAADGRNPPGAQALSDIDSLIDSMEIL